MMVQASFRLNELVEQLTNSILGSSHDDGVLLEACVLAIRGRRVWLTCKEP
jgi:hypothetical protein